MLGVKQIHLIHIAKRRLALSDEDCRAILQNYGNATSSKELDHVGFNQVMIRFEQLGFQSDWKKRTLGHRKGMATPAQVDLIRDLWFQYTGEDSKENDRDLNKWLDKYHGVSAVRMISIQKAAKIIPALKAMANRNRI